MNTNQTEVNKALRDFVAAIQAVPEDGLGETTPYEVIKDRIPQLTELGGYLSELLLTSSKLRTQPEHVALVSPIIHRLTNRNSNLWLFLALYEFNKRVVGYHVESDAELTVAYALIEHVRALVAGEPVAQPRRGHEATALERLGSESFSRAKDAYVKQRAETQRFAAEVGTTAEIAAKLGVSKSEVRRLKAEGLLEARLAEHAQTQGSQA